MSGTDPKSRGVHVMLDLETLGTTAGSVVWALGAWAVIDGRVSEHRSFYRLIDIADAGDCGLQIDPPTLAWWLDPERPAAAVAELRKALGGEWEKLAEVLRAFDFWMGALVTGSTERVSEILVWGNGASFDPVLLAACYDAVGMPLPWNHRSVRCYRTLKSLFPDVVLARGDGQVHHRADDDARAQAEHLARLLRFKDEGRRMKDEEDGGKRAIAPTTFAGRTGTH